MLVCQLVYLFVICWYIWEYGNMGIWEYGNMRIWEYGFDYIYRNMGIWEYGNMRIRTTGHTYENIYVQDYRTYTYMGTYVYI